MKKYNILILSNPKSKYASEDKLILESFIKDGHNAEIRWIDYDENLDSTFDIILRRDTWVEDENDIERFKFFDEKLKERLKNKNLKVVNMFEIDSFR